MGLIIYKYLNVQTFFEVVWHRIRITLRYFYAPPLCAYCRRLLCDQVSLCASCVSCIEPVVSQQIAITKRRTVVVRAIGRYKDPLKRLVVAKSWSDRTAACILGDIMVRYGNIHTVSFDYIVPVPLHWRRYAWRGYNQAYEIAHVVARHTGKPIANIITRHRHSPIQPLFRGSDRLANVAGAFIMSEISLQYQLELQGKEFLIIDDVTTTGATIREVSHVLLQLRPRNVTGMVICRG